MSDETELAEMKVAKRYCDDPFSRTAKGNPIEQVVDKAEQDLLRALYETLAIKHGADGVVEPPDFQHLEGERLEAARAIVVRLQQPIATS